MDGFVDLGIPGIVEAEAVGSGGVATVYRAVQTQLSRTVAVKVIQGIRDPTTTRRFEREASALGSLSEHPGIVTLYSTGTNSAQQPYFIMQYCPNGSLQDQLNTHGPMAAAQACRAISQIANSIADAHDLGVLHRDLKPANILIDSAGRYLVADFGIAAIADATAGISTSVSYTAGYVPPEILQGQPPTTAGDVYSLGATLYALLQAKMPFASAQDSEQNLLALVLRLGTEEIEDTRAHGVPDAVATLIERCLAKDPARRPGMRELATLAATAAHAPASDVRPPPPAAAPAPAQVAPPVAPVATPSLPVLAHQAAPAPQTPQTPQTPQALPTPHAPQSPQPRRNAAMFSLVGVIALLIVGAGAFLAIRSFSGDDPPPPNDLIEVAGLDDTLGAAVDDIAQGQGAVEDLLADGDPAEDLLAEELLGEDATPEDGAAISAVGSVALADSLRLPAGEGGELVLLQSAPLAAINPYVDGRTSAAAAGSVVLEPLARIAPDGVTLIPALATEIPTRENGGVSADGTTVLWTLRRDITWSDGTPFTAADVAFTWEACLVAPTGCSSDAFQGVDDVVATGDYAVTVISDDATYPYAAFVGFRSPVIQQTQFQDCGGGDMAQCTAENWAPIGTGPYMVAERTDDQITYAMNPSYRGVSNDEPFYGRVVLRSDPDVEANARAVLETGEADYARNLLVDQAVLEGLLESGSGRVETAVTSAVEHISLNQTNNRASGEQQSAYSNGTNPNRFFFENPLLAQALSMAIDRDEIATVAYGRLGEPTCNIWKVNRPASADYDQCLLHDVDQAKAGLDELGFIDRNGDGVRELRDGTPLEFDFVTSTDVAHQIVQDLIAADWAEIGVVANMRDVDESDFFGVGSASVTEFNSDIVMFTYRPATPDVVSYLSTWDSQRIPTPDNSWSGSNIPRMANTEYDNLLSELAALAIEDPARAELIARLDTILSYESGAVIPLILRGRASALAADLGNTGPLNSWDSEFWNIQEWHRQG